MVRVHQLLAGRDFSAAGGAVQSMGASMANFAYLVEGDGGAALAVDAAWDVDGVLKFAADRGLRVVAAAFSHRHLDHVGGRVRLNRTLVAVPGLHEFVERGVPVYVGEDDVEAVAAQAAVDARNIRVAREGDTVFPGVTVVHTPGHTPGSVCFRVGDEFILTGDTLFIGSCGRVDLAESDPVAMARSLARLAAFPRSMRVLPGHNYARLPESSIGNEVDFNFVMRESIESLEASSESTLRRNPTLSTSPLPDYLAAARRALAEEAARGA